MDNEAGGSRSASPPTPAPAASDEGGVARSTRRRRRRRGGARKTSEMPGNPKSGGQEPRPPRGQVVRETLPVPTFPPELPITDRIDEIVELLETNRVVVVAGETGSGKTTQLPKACLAAGIGRRGQIAHTQPRRLAARTVSARIAEEMGVEFGREVGYAVRFDDRVSDDTIIKVMTDGLLLNEIQSDRLLSRYEAIIIDEAHERSLNVDLLIGYMKRLLARRDDLKVIITSATIDVDAFSRHFDDAPIVEVSGRGFPVDIEYRPVDENAYETLAECLQEIARKRSTSARDVLVFQSGEREIFDTTQWLKRRFSEQFEILPLYARLPFSEQQRVFRPSKRQRVVLATNVAETSLTVPNIGYVIDPGFARISRYSYRSKLQRLPIEAVSQASAAQRAGRCGRVGPGVAYRLYDESDFEGRREFTDPELTRTNLASVVLTMRAHRLGEIERFPFIDPPDPRVVRDAVRLLAELGAIEGDRLTKIGHQMARLPVDPRLARMLIEAGGTGALAEVLIVVSGLAIQDPRVRPLDRREAADQAHAIFNDESSDFLALLKVWSWLDERRRETTRSGFRRAMERQFLSPLRVGEWRATHRQLLTTCKTLGLKLNKTPADYTSVHRALVAGSLAFIGTKNDKGDYDGARGLKFRIFPGSGLKKRRPKWLLAAEIADTGATYARTAAEIEPRWVEQAGSHLAKRTYSEPRWDERRGEVVASERVTIYGLVVVADRPKRYAEIDPVVSRELFVESAMVSRDRRLKADFLDANEALEREVRTRQAKGRRADLLVAESVRRDFYLDRLPADVLSVKTFEAWLKRAKQRDLDSLTMTEADLTTDVDVHLTDEAFPASLEVGELSLPVRYKFAPGAKDDGVSIRIDLGLLPALGEDPLEWLVPGFLELKVAALLKSLPKSIRRQLVPIPDRARDLTPVLLGASIYRQGKLLHRLADALASLYGVRARPDDFRDEIIEDHLRVNVQVVGAKRRIVDQGRDLTALKSRLIARVEQQLTGDFREVHEAAALEVFPDDGVPAEKRVKTPAGQSMVYPVLVDRGSSVDLIIQPTSKGQEFTNRQGYARLALLAERRAVRQMRRELERETRTALHFASLGTMAELVDGVVMASAWFTFFDGDALPTTKAAFDERITARRATFYPTFQTTVEHVRETLSWRFEVAKTLDSLTSPAFAETKADASAQLAELVGKDFLAQLPKDRLADIPRYLQALSYRLTNLAGNVERDHRGILTIGAWQSRREAIVREMGRTTTTNELDYAIQELRVATFSQKIKTRGKVSEVRLAKIFEPVEQQLGLSK